MERFIGGLIEHYAGNFPTWLAPVQVRILPVTGEDHPYGRKVEEAFLNAGVRVELDSRNESISLKIREGTREKIPYLLVVGSREAEAGAVAVRMRGKGDLGAQPLEKFLGELVAEIKEKRM
jgi:translation initiation factor IF-3